MSKGKQDDSCLRENDTLSRCNAGGIDEVWDDLSSCISACIIRDNAYACEKKNKLIGE